MQVKCAICDTVEGIDDYSLEAKRLRNRRVNLYLCKNCYDRIGKKTKKRHASGNFKLFRENKNEDELI